MLDSLTMGKIVAVVDDDIVIVVALQSIKSSSTVTTGTAVTIIKCDPKKKRISTGKFYDMIAEEL